MTVSAAGYQQIIYGVATQKLTLLVPDHVNVASVTSVEVFPMGTGDDGTAETATTGSASVSDSGNFANVIATSGAGQADPSLIQVDDATSFREGDTHIISEIGVGSETIHVTTVDTDSDYIYTRHPLHNTYSTDADIGQTRIEITVLDSWAADSNNISDDLDPNPGYRVRWVYVGAMRSTDSFTRVVDTYFDLVRYESFTGVTALDLDRMVPGFLSSIPQEYREDRGQSLINTAYGEVKLDLHEADRAAEMVRNRAVMDALVIRKAILLAEEAKIQMGGNNIPGLELAQANYENRLNKLIRISNKTAMADDTSGAGGRSVMPTGVWSK